MHNRILRVIVQRWNKRGGNLIEGSRFILANVAAGLQKTAELNVLDITFAKRMGIVIFFHLREKELALNTSDAETKAVGVSANKSSTGILEPALPAFDKPFISRWDVVFNLTFQF